MFSVDRKFFKKFDWISFFLMLALSSIGLLFIYSATYKPEIPYSIFFKKQLFGILSGVLLYLFFSIIDHRQLIRFGYFLYFIIIGLLVFTIVKGSIGMGAKRWINLVFIKWQPSEMAKLLFPAFAVYFLHTQKDNFSFTWKDFAPILAILAISTLLILKQPDLGTALILLFSGLIIIWLAGIGKKFFVISFLLTLLLTPITWNMLKPYQKKRVSVFLGYGESKKERYQIEQSQISIGSGGLWGKGILKGTQNRLSFLPERRTDFIFSVICEELGFLGALLILFLYILLGTRIFLILIKIDSPLVTLFGVGIALHIFISALVNMYMVTGLLPIVGIPLPLVSYGLSNLWTTFITLGCLNSIKIQKTH
ncbi:FtsW/RodA/SpoVE family cell cycle protein [Candidatus Dependentiae bacterium]